MVVVEHWTCILPWGREAKGNHPLLLRRGAGGEAPGEETFFSLGGVVYSPARATVLDDKEGGREYTGPRESSPKGPLGPMILGPWGSPHRAGEV